VTGQGKIYALDSSGGKKWEKSYSRPQGPTLAEDGTIYLLSDVSLAALDASGNEQWTYSTGDDVIFGITLGEDGTLYQGSWDKYFYAVNSDGSLKWKYLTDGCVSYPATIDDEGFIYLGGGDAHCGEDKYLYSFTSDGTLRWRYDTGALRVGSPAVGPDGLLYVPASPTLLVLDSDGNLEWSLGGTNDEVAGIITPGIASDGTIYLGNSKGVISAVDPSSHEIKWTYQTGSDPTDSTKFGVLSFPVVDSDGTVFAGAVDGKMYAVDKDGNLKWSYSTDGHVTEASPAIGSDGTLYFSSEDGYVYAIGN
jgi:outer membrane protein assembly factor BamB